MPNPRSYSQITRHGPLPSVTRIAFAPPHPLRAIVPRHHPRHRRRSAGQAVQGARCSSLTRRPACRATLETDAEGRYEASNLRPGTYRVEVVTTNFKKFERTGVLVRAAGTALVDVTLELGGVNETVTVSAEARQQHHAREPGDRPRPRRAAAPRPAAQQPRHPVVPAPQPERGRRRRRHPVPGRQDLRRVVHPGRTGVDQRHLRHHRQLRAWPRRDLGDHGALELLQRRVRRPGGRRRDDQARRQQLPRHQLLRLQQRQPERADLQPDARGRRARRSPLRHARAPVGRKHRRPARSAARCSSIANYEGSNNKAIFGGWPGDRSDGGDAERRLPRHRDHPARPADRAALPGSGDSSRPHRSRSAGDHGLLLSAAQSGNDRERVWRLPAVRARDARTRSAATSESTTS